MTQEEKSLLLQDLCARLQYGVICEIGLKPYKLKGINKHKKLWWFEFDGFRCLDGVKPYLRPMSSMTEEEAKDYIRCKYSSGKVIELRQENGCNISTNIKLMWLDVFDFLNAHHFDYRGLIEKGLALEAPKGMY